MINLSFEIVWLPVYFVFHFFFLSFVQCAHCANLLSNFFTMWTAHIYGKQTKCSEIECIDIVYDSGNTFHHVNSLSYIKGWSSAVLTARRIDLVSTWNQISVSIQTSQLRCCVTAVTHTHTQYCVNQFDSRTSTRW